MAGAEQTPLHMAQQHARALLGLLRADLQRLEARSTRHAGRLRLSDEDRPRMERALQALRTVEAEVEQLWREAPAPRG